MLADLARNKAALVAENALLRQHLVMLKRCVERPLYSDRSVISRAPGKPPVTDALYFPVCTCFVVALGSRRVVHVGVTRHPTDAWVARQLCEATPFAEQPQYRIRDNDRKYGPAFARVAEASWVTPC